MDCIPLEKHDLKEMLMSKKKRAPGKLPQGNRSVGGPDVAPLAKDDDLKTGGGAPASEQDVVRRLGHFQTAGEHAIQQPGGRHGGRRDA
jgi:hypothetical protein